MYVLAGDRAKQIAHSGIFWGNLAANYANGALKLSYAPFA